MASEDPASRFEGGLARIEGSIASLFAGATDENALRAASSKIVGPHGELTELMKLMREIPGDRKRELGKRANAVKTGVEQAFERALHDLKEGAKKRELEGPGLDVTLPGRGIEPGPLAAPLSISSKRRRSRRRPSEV